MIRRVLPFLALTVGLGLTIWLLAATNLASVVDSFTQIGWGVLAVVGVRAAMIAINAAAWRQLLGTLVKLPFSTFALLRWIREAIDVLLPVAGIGGSFVSARLLTYWCVAGATALASVFADVLLQTAAQAVFALTGAALLARVVGLGTLLPAFLVGGGLVLIALSGFYLVQRYRGARLIGGVLRILSGREEPRFRRSVSGFQTAEDALWRGRGRNIIAALVTHICAWTLGTLEVWFALHFMEWPVTFEQALVLESLGASISSAAFFIPGSWGVQEGGYILIGQLLGVPAPLALSLSLVKRIPDLLLGTPGIFAWRVVEARHLFGKGIPAG